MRRMTTVDRATNTTMIREITLSSTTGVNVETYFPKTEDSNNDEKVIENQNKILNNLTNVVGTLAAITDRQTSTFNESDYVYKTLIFPIENLDTVIKYYPIMDGEKVIPNGSVIKDMILNITSPFKIGTVVSIVFNTQTLATITIRDESVQTYSIPIKKIINYVNDDSNNLNLRVGAPDGTDNSEAVATAEITIGYRAEI